MVKKPTFIISIDTELVWGYALYPEDKAIKVMLSDTSKARDAINALLAIFDKYNIPATWAVVGHLFLEHCTLEECTARKNISELKGEKYTFDPCTNIDTDPLYYGRDIIDKILSSKVEHEIGYHSFSHIPFSECSREVAEAEIEKGIELAGELGIKLKSFIFPEDKIGHIEILKKYGFTAYRGLIAKRRSLNRSFFVRAKNLAINELIANPVEPRWIDGIWELPSSMLFSDPLFPFTLLPRAKGGINRAIRENKIFHIWLHPSNLLTQKGLSKRLEAVIAYVDKRRQEGKLHVATMGGFVQLLKHGKP